MIENNKSKTPSFSKEVKEEIVSNQYTQERIRTLLSGFFKVNGAYHISGQNSYLSIETENAKVAKFIYQNIINIFHFNPKLSYSKTSRLGKKTIYRIIIESQADELLENLDIDFFEGKISKTLTYNDDVIGGYLAGAFLAGGSVSSPFSSNYHLEIALNHDNHAKWLAKLINNKTASNFTAKIIKRRNKYVVYLKRSDHISDFLVLIGASNCCLRFENIRLDRDFTNVNNRLVNCDSANYKKSVKASEEQIKAINKIIAHYGSVSFFENEKLIHLVNLRLEYPEASLNELKDKLSDKLNIQVSKSNINHMFRKIIQIASEI